MTVLKAALEKAFRENHGGQLAAVYTYSGLFRVQRIQKIRAKLGKVAAG